MNILLFDDQKIRTQLLPFTFLRPIAEIRTGILKISEKWKMSTNGSVSYLTEPYLSGKFSPDFASQNTYINGSICPTFALIEQIKNIQNNEAIFSGDLLVATKSDINFSNFNELQLYAKDQCKQLSISRETFTLIDWPWNIFKANREEIKNDFSLITKGRKSQPITDKHTIVYGEDQIFLEEGAQVKAAILNAEDGPIYIGKNAKIQEGAIVKGALALCEGAQVNMGAKIRGDNTFGPYSKVGGEINNSVIFGYSNKGHDGYLGNSVVGEWCNFGADTNNSNLKNNYSEVKLWNYEEEKLVGTGQQFCGLMMGDHSKCGINTMFNTGTVVGIGAIIFGSGFPNKFIPSFTWGGVNSFDTYQLSKMLELATHVMERKGIDCTEQDRKILQNIFETTAKFRSQF
ncbi:GlmU family protein [Flexithrix dorotheae]|uniref:GlmU family protein n=1 Tax=Flexithrix dorotheae TaxID=70993 RepID=UPI00037784CD|nr:GlmU family protein [Flexithrix dorotheae]